MPEPNTYGSEYSTQESESDGRKIERQTHFTDDDEEKVEESQSDSGRKNCLFQIGQ